MVATVDFSAGKAKNLVTRLEGDLTVVTANEEYQLPEEPVPESIAVILDGRDLHADADNGFTFTAPDLIALKEPKRNNHFLMIRYLRK